MAIFLLIHFFLLSSFQQVEHLCGNIVDNYADFINISIN